ncbi:MAG TPA: (Fe-S)-binding protein, partial [bacterium]|nr:(Fe-S)-binding protein [bacterium]
EVKSYLEVLAEKGMTPVSKKEDAVVVHDSCVYARHEGVVDEPRQLLERAGVTIKNPRECKKLTFCCGGPAESLFPSKAFAVGAKRMKQLSKEGNKVAVMCPICYANLKHAANKDVQLVDMADYLGECYL